MPRMHVCQELDLRVDVNSHRILCRTIHGKLNPFLFGIGLTNLPEMDQAESLSKVQGNYPVLSPQLKVLEEAQVYQPPNTIYMPYPLSTPARPFFMR